MKNNPQCKHKAGRGHSFAGWERKAARVAAEINNRVLGTPLPDDVRQEERARYHAWVMRVVKGL